MSLIAKFSRNTLTTCTVAALAVSISGTALAQSTSRNTTQSNRRTTTTQSGSSSRNTSTATTTQSGSSNRNTTKTMAAKAKMGLEGYCPVCVIDARKWEKGNPRISSTFDGVNYYFPTAALKTKFDRNPKRYVPALNGDCIVCLENAGKRVPGNVRHAAMHNGRLYLFPSDKEKQVFGRSPEAFDKTDLAVDGECIVCLVKAKKHVSGVAEHTVMHGGMRYLFPSDAEAKMFEADPKQFLTAVKNMKPAMQK